ncbi:AAA family ATPase [Bradyrhizobium sp. UFLA05-112]
MTNNAAYQSSKAVKSLPFTTFDDIDVVATRRSIFKGLIARGEISSWIGPPGSGKSSLVDDLAVHCAQGKDCFGHRAREMGGVLIIALERADLHKRRLAVYRQRDGVKGLPIAVAGTVIDLMRPYCIDTIVATVRAAESRFNCPFGMVVIDTYNKAIAIGGGDEDKARDQNIVAANLRSVQEKLDVHIALVGHTGKDQTRGARGSNAHLGDVDVMIQISGDGPVKVAKVTKANDQPERDLVTFRLGPFVLGHDEDGDPVDVAVIEPVTGSGTGTATKAKPSKLTELQRAGLRELYECIADHAEPPPNDPHCPPGSKGVSLDTWRERMRKRSVIGGKGERAQFMRMKRGLCAKDRIGIWDEFVWVGRAEPRQRGTPNHAEPGPQSFDNNDDDDSASHVLHEACASVFHGRSKA